VVFPDARREPARVRGFPGRCPRARTLDRELDAGRDVGIHRLAADLRAALRQLDPSSAVASARVDRDASFLVRDRPDHVMIFRSPAFPRIDWQSERRLTAAARDRTLFVSAYTIGGFPTRAPTLKVDRSGADALVVPAAPSTAGVHHILSPL
jgi:hypothetical protein